MPLRAPMCVASLDLFLCFRQERVFPKPPKFVQLNQHIIMIICFIVIIIIMATNTVIILHYTILYYKILYNVIGHNQTTPSKPHAVDHIAD